MFLNCTGQFDISLEGKICTEGDNWSFISSVGPQHPIAANKLKASHPKFTFFFVAKHIFLVVLHVFVKSPFGKYIAKLSKPSGERGTLKCHSNKAQTQNPGWICKFQLNCPDFTISPLLPQRTPRIYCHYLGGKTPLSDRDLSFSKAEGTRCLSKLPRSHFVCMQNRRYFHPCSLTSLTHTHES